MTFAETIPIERDVTVDWDNKQVIEEDPLTIFRVTNGANVVWKNGNMTSPRGIVQVDEGATLTIESGSYMSGDVGLRAGTDTTSGNLIINGGTFRAQEFVGMVFGENSTLTINDGEFTAIDNAVVGGNGLAKYAGTTTTINGGTFYGQITSPNYIACGIYHPQDGTLIVNGGTFNVTNGVGILVRGGDVTINDVTVNTTGEVQGKVGDSRVLTTCSALYVDGVSTYPGWTNCHTTVKGGTFNSEATAVTVTVPEGENKADRLAIEGGVFNGETNPSF